ncbi:MAG TPA: hypothetical protein VFJ61_05020 [Solirubrobacterales bacterium]|nr:hypothetical protein [Solirubrobacterales bacterium]
MAGSAAAAPVAVPAYGYSHTIASQGQITDPFNTYTAVAVERGTGNVLFADANSFRVAVFAPDAGPGDAPLTSFGEGQPGGVAVDRDSGAIYVMNLYGAPLTRWTSDGAPVPTYTRDQDFAPELNEFGGSIAVDPTTGDLIVLEAGAGEVVRLDSSGKRLASFPSAPGFTQPFSVSVSAQGDIYLYDGGEPAVRRYSPDGNVLEKLRVKGSVQTLAIDPVSGSINVVTKVEEVLRIEGFDGTGKLIYEVPFPASLAGGGVRGIDVDPDTGRLYAFTAAASVTGIAAFERTLYAGAEAPVVSALTTESAHVSAEVDPGAGPPAGSSAYFEYSGDGGKTWTATASEPLTAAGTVEADLTGLSPNVDYLVRVVAANDLVAHTSKPTAFTTVGVVPVTVTGAATDIAETSAVINGTIDTIGLQTTYHFEYGLTSAYGSRVPAGIEAVAGEGRQARIFSRTLKGLQPGATYHYRLVAQNSIGISAGEDRTFTTLTPGVLPVRAYEQVTPVDKLGGTIDGTVGFQAAQDGSAFSYITRSPGDSDGSPQFARFISRRGSDDWQGGIPTDPPLNTPRSTVFTTTTGISPDFSHALVVSNRDLTPNGEGVENGANFYRENLVTGEFDLALATDAFSAFSYFTTLQTQNKFFYGNKDYSDVIFGSPVALLPGVADNGLYRWNLESGLQLESILPSGGQAKGELVLPSASGDAQYVSADGSRVYFTIKGAGEDGIYLREGGQTRAISVSRRAGDPDTPQAGLFMGTNKSGRYGYFFTYNAQLTDDAPATEGNIYRYDAVKDELEYIGGQAGPGFSPSNIAYVGVSDDGETFYFAGRNGLEVWRRGAVQLIYPSTSVNLGKGFLSPSGRYIGFEDELADAVYLYDADTEELTCASCLSDGSNPGGANLPENERNASNLIPDAVTDQGELFFDTTSRLVAADVNGEYDVYVMQAGKARLISPGDGPFGARYADISADGRDVFFATAESLVGRDDDQATDIYDARIGGGFPGQNPPPPKECLRDDCKATPNAGPELPFGGSEALAGPGNVTPQKHRRCGKGRHLRKVKGKKRCVKQHHRKAKTNRRHAR